MTTRSEGDELKQQLRSSLGVLALILITAIVYIPAIRSGFIWDDNILVTSNPLIRNPKLFSSIWFSGSAIDYTPLTLTAFWLEWRLWAGHPMGYHIVNIALYAASTTILWQVLRRLAIPGAWLAALLFAIHPVNAASVAWIAEEKNALSLLFYLLAIYWFLGYKESGAWRSYVPSLLAAICAMLSKGSTVVIPAVLVLCIWWKEKAIGWADLRRTAPFFAIAALMSLTTIHFQSRYIPTEVREAFPARLIRAGDAVWFYLWKDMWPFDLCATYPKWPLRPELPGSYLPLLMIPICFGVLWRGRNWWGRGPFFAWTYFMIGLLPVLGVVEMGYMEQAYVADWWQELAIIGVLALAAAGAARAWSAGRPIVKPLLAACGLAVIAALGLGTWHEASGYESMEIHCRRTLARNPDAWGARTNLGTALDAEGRTGEALIEYQKALRLRPRDRDVLYDLGNAYQAQGDMEQAERYYEKTLEITSKFAPARINLGNIMSAEGRAGEAIEQYQEALRDDPEDAEACSNLGTMLKAQGRLDEALVQYRNAARFEPDSAEIRNNLGSTLAARDDLEGAVAQYREALRLNPGYAEAYNNLGNALRKQGKLKEAVLELQHALQLKPSSALIRANLADALQAEGP